MNERTFYLGMAGVALLGIAIIFGGAVATFGLAPACMVLGALMFLIGVKIMSDLDP